MVSRKLMLTDINITNLLPHFAHFKHQQKSLLLLVNANPLVRTVRCKNVSFDESLQRRMNHNESLFVLSSSMAYVKLKNNFAKKRLKKYTLLDSRH